MLGNQRISHGAVFAEGSSCADLISAHQPGITRDISRQYCRQSSLDSPAGHETQPHLCPKPNYQSTGAAVLPERLEPDFSGTQLLALGRLLSS